MLTVFTPSFSKFADELCGGLAIEIVNRNLLESVGLGFALLTTLRSLYGEQFKVSGVKTLLANKSVYDHLISGTDIDGIVNSYQSALSEWIRKRERFLLY